MGPQRPRAEKTRPCAETSIYQFWRVGLSASCPVTGTIDSAEMEGGQSTIGLLIIEFKLHSSVVL